MVNNFTLFNNKLKFGVLLIKTALYETKFTKKSKILHLESKVSQKISSTPTFKINDLGVGVDHMN